MKHGPTGKVPVPASPAEAAPTSSPHTDSSGGYRLTPVRKARERAEVMRRGELASAIGDAQLAEQMLAEARQRTVAAREQLARALAARDQLSSATADLIRSHDQFIARCRNAVGDMVRAEQRANAAADAQASSVDNARATLAHARAEREVIERHFAQWREAQRKLANLRED